MQLLTSDEAPLADAEMILRELGAGDAQFKGTSFGRGECSLESYLQECREREVAETTPADLVPQSVYWLADAAGRIVGIVRVRHFLNASLMQYGGHIGYYVRPSERGKGYGREALRLALVRLRKRGVMRALFTVNPKNAASIRVVLANGGTEDEPGVDSISGEVVNRYWIEL